MERASPAVLIDRWVSKVAPEAADWLNTRVAAIAGETLPRTVFIAFAQASRHAGHAALRLSPADRADADSARPGWHPEPWTATDALRARLLLAVPAVEAAPFVLALDRLASAADLGELVALYRALPLLPHPERLAARAAEGVRSNIQAVFDAVALDNPYPAEQLDDSAWNQLVLKALFVGSPLQRIAGLDRRANPRLTRMLCDYAHERWAA
nr:EboA domain-containing protein [Planctomycetota bacterium]